MSPFRSLGIVALALSSLTAGPAFAGLIYTWQDLDGGTANGTVEFAAGVVELESDADILSFSFTTSLGQTFDAASALDALWTLQVGGAFLCDAPCEGVLKKKAAKKLAGGLSFFGESLDDLSLLTWDVSTGKKKAAEKLPGDIETPDPGDAMQETGTGRWALQGTVQVPEPSGLMLLLTGLMLVAVRSFWRKT